MQYGILSFDEVEPDISRKILHVDMDAFYASVEVRDNPKLKNKPVVIAKHPKLTGGRGIVSTCNYEARKYGIHSAMSAQEAYMRCPKAVFIQGDLNYYREISMQIREIFNEYTDLIEPVSLDEAYLDVTNNKKNMKSATIMAMEIKEEVYRRTRLTCSVGISYNKFIAKIASDYNKPNGITLVEPKDAVQFLKELSIDKFHGVGKKSLPNFHDMGIFTGKDLYEKSLDELIDNFGKMGYSLYFKVRGVHNTPVNNKRERKSIGRERTFSVFLELESQVVDNIVKLIHQVDNRHHISDMRAHTITLKIRYDNFETITRQIQSIETIESLEKSIELAKEIWKEHGHLDRTIRLLGVTFSNFDHPLYTSIKLDLD
ncbi:DNA polymerase IV [Aerococcaceae bacterium INB8]|uniref:DNA polymerase IV n=2 Tax=Ruoffia halotolerans TaxID=2748684 RepID=A0A839A5P6_9LACT|nr:DNA polymerase IV [Ruoffia halotolerans]MBA5729023.1 DNA polymerase IV [Ruoffia halotolerans]